MLNYSNNPFQPGNESAYRAWRETKLAEDYTSLSALFVDITDPGHLSETEGQAIADQISKTNMVIFRLANPDSFSTTGLISLGTQLGLNHLDNNLYAGEEAVSELRVIDKGRRGEYIPYTNRALGWHTDGYYNHPDQTIRVFVLYCRSDAADGGENQLVDPELIYISLRDENPEYIKALMNDDVLTIPETVENNKLVRPAQKSPVFSIDKKSGRLLMRYTQRKTYIQWKNDSITHDALTHIETLLAKESIPIVNYRLKPGEGLICNNVLHNRSAFNDARDKQRIMYRARYHDDMTNTRLFRDQPICLT